MENLYQDVITWLAQYGWGVLGAVIILVLGFMASGIIKGTALKLMRRSKMEETLVSFFASLVKVLVLTFVIIAALNQVGFQTASLVAVVGAAGLAVGLAMQGQLANLAAGILLLIFRPFKVGDTVETGGILGTVMGITLLNTRLKTPDGILTIIPNTSVTGASIKNISAEPVRRVDLVIGVGYDDDLAQAKDVLWKILKEDDRVLDDPAARVDVIELADSSVNFAVRPWVLTGEYWNVRCELTEKIKLALDQAGISIPYPQTDVHLIPGEDASEAAS